MSDGDPLFDTKWVHLYEEDTPEGAVYGPEQEARLSRRPRERLTLNHDGSAQVYVPGPDDRPVAQPATWTEERGAFVVRTTGGASLRIVRQSPTRLLVTRRTQSQAPKD